MNTRILVVIVLILAIIFLSISLIVEYYFREVIESLLGASHGVEAHARCYSSELGYRERIGEPPVPLKASTVMIDVWKHFDGALVINKVRVDTGAGPIEVPITVSIPEGIPPLIVLGTGHAEVGYTSVRVTTYFGSGNTLWGNEGSIRVSIEEPIESPESFSHVKDYTITLYFQKLHRGAFDVTLKVKVTPEKLPKCSHWP